MMEHEYLSQADAARAEGVTRQWVNELVKSGRLRSDAHGRVRLADLQAVRRVGLDPSRGKHKGPARSPLLARDHVLEVLADEQSAAERELRGLAERAARLVDGESEAARAKRIRAELRQWLGVLLGAIAWRVGE